MYCFKREFAFNKFWLKDEFQISKARWVILFSYFNFREAAERLLRLEAERAARAARNNQ